MILGERIDFILWTDDDEEKFNIKFMHLPSCDEKSVSIAKLKYVDKNSTSGISANPFSKFLKIEVSFKFRYLLANSTVMSLNCESNVTTNFKNRVGIKNSGINVVF